MHKLQSAHPKQNPKHILDMKAILMLHTGKSPRNVKKNFKSFLNDIGDKFTMSIK